jgi:riboflavin biosynthesis pyrimidine reductase
VVVSASGQIDPAHPGLAAPEVPALVVTTRRGAEQMAGGGLPFDVAIAGEGTVAVERLAAVLGRRGMNVVLCEGGPHLLGQLLAADLVDELFLTVAPQIAGRSDARPRLGLVEGLAFRVTEAPWWRLVSLGRSGDHLFLRYRRQRGDHEDTGVRP